MDLTTVARDRRAEGWKGGSSKIRNPQFETCSSFVRSTSEDRCVKRGRTKIRTRGTRPSDSRGYLFALTKLHFIFNHEGSLVPPTRGVFLVEGTFY